MTQILGVVTQDYALLASDRQLTIGTGPHVGQVFDDDTCKLVSLCNICGIGYTGLARIEGIPTHEWIAQTLAAATSTEPESASQALLDNAGRALQNIPLRHRHQCFLLVGWANFVGGAGIQSHLCLVSNCLDPTGSWMTTPRADFDRRVRALRADEGLLWHAIGQPLQDVRRVALERNLKQLVTRAIGPREALRLLVDEIVYTSLHNRTVGSKILAFCIPRKAVESQVQTGNSMMLAQMPTDSSPAFTYFEPGYDELRQYGPSFACGGFAATDIKTENDPSRDFQSSEMRILRMPGKV